MTPIMANSIDGQVHMGKYFDNIRKNLPQEMTMFNREGLLFFLSYDQCQLLKFQGKNVEYQQKDQIIRNIHALAVLLLKLKFQKVRQTVRSRFHSKN